MVKAIYRDNTFHLIDPVGLRDGEEVELKILPDPEIKKLIGAFKIKKIQTVEKIIESDIFE